ncbi:hypothetical protein cypCar_00029302 [Cyprinus carpio]|nr:hypothetical protein cypCar_00029302 [Cyprinus carpio]
MEHQHAEFVDTHYEALIQRVTSVMPITDKMYENRKLSWEVYSKITKASKKTQTRELLDAVKSGGPAVKSAFYKVLQEVKPDVIQELVGPSSQTDRPENDIVRWNPSSIKY